MKIVVPTDGKKGLDNKIAEHFGRCETYTFLNEKGEVLQTIDNTSEHMGGQGLPPELVKEHGADVLLCKNLGPKALNLCKELGMEVCTGEAETVKDIFEMWKNKIIKKSSAEDTCKRHKT